MKGSKKTGTPLTLGHAACEVCAIRGSATEHRPVTGQRLRLMAPTPASAINAIEAGAGTSLTSSPSMPM